MHSDQLTIEADTVRALLDTQFPQWRGLPIRQLPTGGTVHALFRLGDAMAVRLRLRPDDAHSVRSELAAEAAAASAILGRTRFASPEVVAIGQPGCGYPMPWSVQTWISGTVAQDADAGASVGFAEDLAEFMAGIRAIEVGARTFSGDRRGGRLLDHDEWVRESLSRSAGLLDVETLRSVWDSMRDLPRGDSPDVLNHGDLIPGNVVVSDRRLTGVLDVGGAGPADPALDLVSAWHLLEAGPRRVLRDILGTEDDEWERGRAWAFEQAIGLVWYYVDRNPALSRIGRRTLDRIVADGGADRCSS